jgi:hypothetical protein
LGPEVSKSEGRVAQTTNVIIGGTVTDDSTNEWIALDKKVHPLNYIMYVSLCFQVECRKEGDEVERQGEKGEG